MPDFLVRWEYEACGVTSPEAAVLEAIRTIRNPSTAATIFSVRRMVNGKLSENEESIEVDSAFVRYVPCGPACDDYTKTDEPGDICGAGRKWTDHRERR